MLVKEGEQVQPGQVIARLEGSSTLTLEDAQLAAQEELNSAYEGMRQAQLALDNFDVPNDFSGQTPPEAVEATLKAVNDARAAYEPYKDYSSNNPTAREYKNKLDDAWTKYRKAIHWLDLTTALEATQTSDSTLIDPVIIAGRWLEPGDENAVVIGNHLLVKFPDLKVGDWLNVEMDGKETKWQIVGVYTIVGNVNPPLLYVNYEYLSRLIGRPEQVYSLRILTDQHDEESQRRIGEQIQALYKDAGVQVNTVGLGAKFISQQKSQTDILVYMMLVMATLIAIVGGLGLAGTMSINVLERTREIGVMRAIGASNGNIQSIVIVEGMVVGILSWFVSIFFSIPITFILCYGVGVALLTTPMNAVYGATGIITWLIVTIFISTMPARSQPAAPRA